VNKRFSIRNKLTDYYSDYTGETYAVLWIKEFLRLDNDIAKRIISIAKSCTSTIMLVEGL